MDMTKEVQAYQQAAKVLPLPIRQQALALPLAGQARAEELRLRVGQPFSVTMPEGEQVLGGEPIGPGVPEQLVEIASKASFHAVQDQLRRGYLTIEGGHRIGLCGTAVLREGEIYSFRQMSSATVRIARQVKGAAAPVLPQLCSKGALNSTLILAAPGLGKTTLLRDVIRMVSQGEGCLPRRVSLADERGEIAALYAGQPQLEVGSRTDVVEGCPKAQGLMLLLRAMNPQVLAVDEITAAEDVQALAMAVGCGVTLLATAHGSGRADLQQRGLYAPLLEGHMFQKLVLISREGDGRRYTVEELS